jgi:hypothetical protein
MTRHLVATGISTLLIGGLAAGWIVRQNRQGPAEEVAAVPKHVTTEADSRPRERAASPPPFSTPQKQFPPYEPPAGELYANGKRLAGRVAQELATFPPGASTRELATRIVVAARQQKGLERAVAPLLDPARRSAGETLYAQFSGVTATTLGAMVVVRQHLEDAAGNREQVVRVMDVRLSRTDGPWSLDTVASVGGTAVPRPAVLSTAATRVLDHPDIELPDTARWDIYRGVDNALLVALAKAADRWPIVVSVLSSGHPPNVWGENRPSAHANGYAADLYAVDDELVVLQREQGSSAYQLAAALLDAGARQVGSPWVLPPGGHRSFTDRVHSDHIHLQQRSVSRAHG